MGGKWQARGRPARKRASKSPVRHVGRLKPSRTTRLGPGLDSFPQPASFFSIFGFQWIWRRESNPRLRSISVPRRLNLRQLFWKDTAGPLFILSRWKCRRPCVVLTPPLWNKSPNCSDITIQKQVLWRTSFVNLLQRLIDYFSFFN